MSAEEIIAFVQSDTRTKEEIFEELTRQVSELYGEEISKQEAIEATRRLIGTFEVFGDMYNEKTIA